MSEPGGFLPPTPPQPTEPSPHKPAWWKRRVGVPMWAMILACVVLVGALGAAAGGKDTKDSKGETTGGTQAAVATTSPRSTTTTVATTEAHTGDQRDLNCGDGEQLIDDDSDGWGECQTTFGTRDNPVPVGMTMPGGDFDYQIIAFENNGVDALIHDFNPYNDPPPAGKITVRVRVKATFTGTGAGSAYGIQINLVGASGTTYGENAYVCCTDSSDRLGDQPDTFNGGAIEGWIYYQVSIEDASGKLLAFDPNVNYTDVPGGVGFFAVN